MELDYVYEARTLLVPLNPFPPISLPLEGTLPLEMQVADDTGAPIPDLDLSLVQLSYDRATATFTELATLATWNTTETPVFSCGVPYSFADIDDRLILGMKIASFPAGFQAVPDDYAGMIYYLPTERHRELYTGAADSVYQYLLQLRRTDAPPSTNTTIPRTETSAFFTSTTTATITSGILPGDVDENGSVSVADLVLLARCVAQDSTVQLSKNGILNADCTGDGVCDADDLTRLSLQLAGLTPDVT